MKHVYLASCALLLSSGAWGEETPLKFNGYFDSYYQFSPQGHAPAGGAGAPVVEGRVFDNLQNQITLNLVEVSLSKRFDDVVIRADLAFGQQADAMATNGTIDPQTGQPVGADAESTRNVTQAYVAYTPADLKDVTLTLGKFYAFIGLEGFHAQDNWQYSRSFGYNYNPYWHEGVSVRYAVRPDALSATLYYLNASDGRISQEGNRSPSIGASLSAKVGEAWFINYNYLGGKESSVPGSRRDVHELNSTYRLDTAWAFAMDYAFARQTKALLTGEDGEWWSAAAYVKYQPRTWYYLSPRYEYVDDSNQGVGLSAFGASGGVKQRIQSLTLTNSFRLRDGLELKAEYRSEWSNANEYFKAADGTPARAQSSYTLAALFGF